MQQRQRTRSRSRARSQTAGGGAADADDDVYVALHRLLGKLRQHQPLYAEEDVAAIPYPVDGGGSCGSSPSASAPVSPRLSPSLSDSEELVARRDEGDACSAPATQEVPGRKGGKGSASAAAKAAASSAGSSTGGSIDLDGPLSPALFVTAINLFDAKMLSKSKRVSTDALKLVRQAYALVWDDAGYLETLLNGDPLRSGATAGLGGGRRSSHAVHHHHHHHAAFPSSAPSPTQTPSRQLVLLLDECIRVLLVYANASVNFCHSVVSNCRVLLLLAFVCCAARRLEEEDEAPGLAADIAVGNRNLRAEMCSLELEWQGCGIEGRVADLLQECYLVEFLLDAALPPAVCSSRYDGLLLSVFEKKRKIVSDMVASRAGFAHMIRTAPLRGLCGLANMSAFGDARLRARLLDKMAAEGVVERLASEVTAAMAAALSTDSAPPSLTPSPGKRRRSSGGRGGSPPQQRPRAAAAGPSSRRSSMEIDESTRGGGEQERRASPAAGSSRVSFGLEKLLHVETTPVERVGQCVDILMLLSSPNLRPPDSAEASPRSSTSSSPAAVRATTWATREAPLREISLHLLAICFLPKTHARYAELASLQLHATDCVLQWAAYSGTFYAMVVHALDELLDMIEAAGTAPPPRGTSRSPTRSPPPGKREASGACAVPGQSLLARLLPGDESGLLPLLINLLQYTIHAEANTTSVQRWFQFLADRLLPDVFEAPQLTTGRRSTAEWGRQHQGQPRHSQPGSRASSSPSSHATTAAPDSSLHLGSAAQRSGVVVLARDLTRAEAVAAAPYFRFVRQLVEETSWRAGTAALLSKVVLLAFNVIVTQGHRCNLVFGQACACYDAAAPLVLAAQEKASSTRGSRRSSAERRSAGSDRGSSGSGNYRCSAAILQQQRLDEDEEARRQSLTHLQQAANGTADDGEGMEVFIDSAVKRQPSPKRERRSGSPTKRKKPSPPPLTVGGESGLGGEVTAGFSPFISSPSASPIFYEPFSPSAADAEFHAMHRRRDRSVSDEEPRSSDLRAALDEAATPPPQQQAPPADSPEAVTQSWVGRLSLRSLFASLASRDEDGG